MRSSGPPAAGCETYFFFNDERYATRASRSSFGSDAYFAGIGGLRSALAFAVISAGLTIQSWISAAVSLLPTSSRLPFGFPLPAIE